MLQTTERVVKCPQCQAPLAPRRFAPSVVCDYCGTTVQVDPLAVQASRFQRAWAEWNDPATHGYTQWWTLGTSHWAPGPRVGQGGMTDVYVAERARTPTERVLIKVLRDPAHLPLLDHEWEVLRALQASQAEGAPTFTALLPQPVTRGELSAGPHAGRHALVLRWPGGFVRTLEDARRVYPAGVPPETSVWMWRRVLEVLSFLHRSGYVHGAVLPPHLLLQTGEHGVRLVGFSCAERLGEPLRAFHPYYRDFYPGDVTDTRRPRPEDDVAMSARCLVAVLGGDPERGTVPGAVPAPLALLLRQVARGEYTSQGGDLAWTLRERVGEVGRAVFGPPSFQPLVMP
ncbi:hypothetical protein [Melittangium boletus]|uniref:hypothetical protein n=1 Tax=Melittangium boletus TaxID=83453 RepID=UPI003DA5F2FB